MRSNKNPRLTLCRSMLALAVAALCGSGVVLAQGEAKPAEVQAEAQNALQLEAVAEAAKKAKAEQEAMAKAQEAAVSAVRSDTQALLSKLAVAEQEAETYGMTEVSVYRLLAARAADRAEMNAFGDANDTVIAELKAQDKAYLDLAEAAGAKASREATRKAGEDARGVCTAVLR